MPTRRRLLGAGAAGLALAGVAASPLGSLAQDATPPAGAGDDTEGNATPIVGTPVLRPAIDMIRAQEIALEGNAGAAVAKVELDGDDGVLEYAVTLDNGLEVSIDATSGTVIKTEQEDDDRGDDQGDDGGDDDSGENEDGNDDDPGDNEDGDDE